MRLRLISMYVFLRGIAACSPALPTVRIMQWRAETSGQKCAFNMIRKGLSRGRHRSFPSSGTLWMWLNKESSFPAVWFLTPPCGRAASWGASWSWASRGSPRHAGEPMTWWYVLSTGLLGPVLMGWARASHSGNVGLPASAQQRFCKGTAPSARKLPCFQLTCSARVHIRTDTLLNVKG